VARYSIPNQIIADPGVQIGHLKILQRTDGKYVVTNPLLALGKSTIAIKRTLDDAIVWARKHSNVVDFEDAANRAKVSAR
jgi:hypothetical protein